MTISNNYTPFKQIGNGATVDFSPSWDPLVSTNIRVYLEDIVSGTQVLITEGGGASQYSLVINSGGSGFTVTFNTAPTSADYIVIVREVSLIQGTNYTTSKGFQGTVLEGSLDKLTAISQDVSDKANRSVKFPEGSSLNGVLPGAPIDGYGLVWDGVSGKIRNTTSSLSDLEGDAEIVADNIGDINTVAGNIDDINDVAADIANVNLVANNIDDVVDAGNAIGSALKWVFQSNTSMSQPSQGGLRLNNGTESSVTAIAVDNETAQDGNPDVSDYVAGWGVSTSADKGFIRINKGGEAATFAIYKINAAVQDNSGWLEISVSYVDGAGSFSNDDDLFVGFTQAGDEGTGTPGDGTVTTPKIANGAVTNAKISDVNASKVNDGVLDEARLPEASTTEKGAVVKATTLNMTNGDADKFPDAEKVKAYTEKVFSYARYIYTTLNNVVGPSYAAGAWVPILLNAEDYDPDSIGSLSGNRVALPAGSYQIAASSSAKEDSSGNSQWRTRVYDFTGSNPLLISSTSHSSGGGGGAGGNTVFGVITLDVASIIGPQLYTTGALNGGVAMNTGDPEVWNTFSITRIRLG